MFDEVIIALTQKFNIEGMKAKVEPLNDSRAEWIYFKNKKGIEWNIYLSIARNSRRYRSHGNEGINGKSQKKNKKF